MLIKNYNCNTFGINLAKRFDIEASETMFMRVNFNGFDTR